jgi:23S rRNA (cytidine2498-2'-O)-methyltransferase
VNLLLPTDDCAPALLDELRRAHPGNHHELRAPGIVLTDANLTGPFVFSRQALLNAIEASAESIKLWSDVLFRALATLPDGQPWQLHVIPATNRCRLIREALLDRLKQQRRHLLKSLGNDGALVQLLLTAPNQGWISVVPPPLPRQLVSPFPAGLVPVAIDKAAPARAFAKLVEAETRLGRPIANGETCVDLGAAPGSWSYVALQRGASVIAVDRAPLRADLMRHPRLEFRQGDAFRFVPDKPVDWLLCDVIATPDRSMELLLDWLRQRRCRFFVVTIKFKGHEDYPVLERLKMELPALTRSFNLLRLCANKNEACAFGIAR